MNDGKFHIYEDIKYGEGKASVLFLFLFFTYSHLKGISRSLAERVESFVEINSVPFTRPWYRRTRE